MAAAGACTKPTPIRRMSSTCGSSEVRLGIDANVYPTASPITINATRSGQTSGSRVKLDTWSCVYAVAPESRSAQRRSQPVPWTPAYAGARMDVCQRVWDFAQEER